MGVTATASTEVTAGGEHVLVRATGEFDVATADSLAVALLNACKAGQDVVLDLAEVTFMDVTAAGIIAGAHTRLRRSGHKLLVRNPPPSLVRVADALGLADVLALGKDRPPPAAPLSGE